MDASPSLLFTLTALLSGFCAGGWLAWKINQTHIDRAPGDNYLEKLRASRTRRMTGAAGALAVLSVSLLFPVQSMVITSACVGYALTTLLHPRPDGERPDSGRDGGA
ncbi:hypothetical protein [Desulfovibrio aminophilus]|uniref:hypothetical protein n=1 Tax=Desulfovibrio aminophilus TaxID=81425 RepID=UPI0033950A66